MAAGTPVGLIWRNWKPYGGESKISLNSADTATFIRLYQQEEVLWNVNLPDHTHKPTRIECLQRISKMMGKNWSTEQVRDKIMSLRSRYSKEIVKVRVSITSGANPCYQPVWRYFPMLDSFLRPFSVTRKTDTPVVRAFHKRLMEGGISANQPPALALNYTNPARDVSPTATSHFFHSPAPANTISGSQYQRNQQGIPSPLLEYLDDDDVQIIEEDVSKVMEEVAMLMDGQGDDDGDSGYNGGFQVSRFGNDGVVESGKSSRSGTKDEGICISPLVGGDLVSGEGTSGKDGGLLRENGEESSNHCDLPRNRESVPDLTQVGTQQVQPPLRNEEQSQNSACVRPIDTVHVGPDQNVSGLQRSKEGAGSDNVVIKQERPTSLQSPPPPPLPRRLSLTDIPAEDRSTLSNSGWISHGHQAFCLDNTVRDSDHGTKRRQSYSGEGHVREPLLKRIKQEKDSESFAENFFSGEANTPDFLTEMGQQEMTSACGLNPANRDHAGADTISKRISEKTRNQGYQTYASQREVSSPSASSSSHRNIPRKATNLRAREILPPSDPTVNRTKETASPASNDRNSAASIVHQVTDAVSNQMTTLLQTLVTSLVDKSSGDGSSDGNMAFVNHVRAELTKLDEDLQADVKFSIQKVIYEAQKEMSRRRTHNGNNCV